MRESVCESIPPSEFVAWSELTGNFIRYSEYKILRAMDAAYCAEINIELLEYDKREAARLKD